jgi:hypothetical protein
MVQLLVGSHVAQNFAGTMGIGMIEAYNKWVAEKGMLIPPFWLRG